MIEGAMSAWDNFPSFESAFGKQEAVPVPLYLTLLGPSPDATCAIEEIAASIRRSGENFTFELRGLLAQPNWRPHLVAAVALLINGANDEQLGLLWNAIKRPSWVSPQLVASASQLDAAFSEHARDMIQARCVFDDATLPQMNWPERHSALGPSSCDQHRAKLISSLIGLCETRRTLDRGFEKSA